MPLDPSIALSVRNPRIEYNPVNPINAMLQGEQLRGAREANALRQLQMQQSQREMQQEEVANRLLGEAVSPEGEIDYNRVIQGLAGAGQASKIPALLAQREQAGVRQAQMQAAQATRQKAMLDQALSVLKGANEQNYPTLRSAIISQAPALGQFFPETYDKASIDALVGRVEQEVAKVIPAGGALVGKSGQELYRNPAETKGPAPTELAKLLMERAKFQEGSPEHRTYSERIRALTAGPAAPSVTVNAYEPASKQAQGKFIDAVSEERKALRNVPDTILNIEQAKNLIPSAKAFMGKGGEPMLAAASFLNNRLGFGINTQGVVDATELRTRLFQGILDNLKKLDSQPTQKQQDALQEALGNLGTDPGALPRVLDRIEEALRLRVDQYNKDVTDSESRGVRFPFKPQIELPARKVAPGSQIPGPGATKPPAAAVEFLRANPGTKAQFDAKYGAGAADLVLRSR